MKSVKEKQGKNKCDCCGRFLRHSKNVHFDGENKYNYCHNCGLHTTCLNIVQPCIHKDLICEDFNKKVAELRKRINENRNPIEERWKWIDELFGCEKPSAPKIITSVQTYVEALEEGFGCEKPSVEAVKGKGSVNSVVGSQDRKMSIDKSLSNDDVDVWYCGCGTWTPCKKGSPKPICEVCRRSGRL